MSREELDYKLVNQKAREEASKLIADFKSQKRCNVTVHVKQGSKMLIFSTRREKLTKLIETIKDKEWGTIEKITHHDDQ